MKKGSHVRKCNECNQVVFWVIPTGNVPLGLFREVTTKKVTEYRFRSGRLWCIDCYRKAVAEGRCEK